MLYNCITENGFLYLKNDLKANPTNEKLLNNLEVLQIKKKNVKKKFNCEGLSDIFTKNKCQQNCLNQNNILTII